MMEPESIPAEFRGTLAEGCLEFEHAAYVLISAIKSMILEDRLPEPDVWDQQWTNLATSLDKLSCVSKALTSIEALKARTA